jgi:hypothetical protein
MNTIKLKYISIQLALVILSLGCTKDFKKINTDPIAYSGDNFNPNYLLTSAQLNYTGISSVGDAIRSNFIYSATLIQGMSSVLDFWAGDKYLLNEQYAGAYFEGSYQNQIKYIVDLIETTKDNPKYKNLYQISRIMKALIFQRVTDLYGDVPYFEAGKGFYTNNYFVSYDPQEKIYEDLLKEVDEAVAALDVNADKPSGDAFYKGDIEKWKRFGNTLLLRIAMRLTKVNPTISESYAKKVQGKTMQSNADNAFLVHQDLGNDVMNRNTRVLNGDSGPDYYYVKWSKTFIDFLKSENDPRLSKVAVTQLYLSSSSKARNPNFITDPLAQKGMPNGKDQSGRPGLSINLDPTYTGFPDYSSVNPYMAKKDGPTFILTYAESEFLLAEAAERWNAGGSPAAAHYKNGVKAAITFLSQYDPALTISDGVAETYVNDHPYDPLRGLELINNQYWLNECIMLDFYDAWFNWRRTGFPTLTPVNYPNNVTGGTIPRRLSYPVSEASNNPENYTTASNAVPGGDNLAGHVWWDKQ